MPRVKSNQAGKSRHDPLLVQLKEDEVEAKYGKIREPGKRKKSKKGNADDEEGGPGEVILDPKTSRKIFELAQEQQEELEEPEDEDVLVDHEDTQIRTTETIGDLSDDEEEMQDADEDAEEVEEFEIDADDLNTLDALLPPNRGERRTLADIIFAKLDGADGTGAGNAAVIQNVQQQDPDRPDPALGLDPRVVDSFEKLGVYLRGYRSGSLPKLFKVIPTLPAWARLLALTAPENWSPAAAYAATRIFISTMKPNQAQLFLSVVLLDAVREDISNNVDGRKAGGKKLNVHYYNALKRALYKPAAFFKGIVFPMLDSGCTLKEAAIIASILSKTKIPVLHSSAAMLRIAEMEYSGPNSLFLRVLIDKKYELPYKVVDALVFHFIRLSNTYKRKTRGDADKLPVLWHQSLLVFVQRYASDLTPDQKDALLDVIRANPHPQISSEVRRELVSSVERGAPRQDGEGDVEMS